jgi:GNAT superfamily N-acetyltransferase
MKEEIRLVRPEEFKQAAALADRTFRDAEHNSMAVAFPRIFAPEVPESYGAFDGERLVAFMGLVPQTMHIGAATLKTYSLGSVCTDKEYRGKGLAGELLNRIIHHAEDAGGSLLFVSGGRSLYRRADCHPFESLLVWQLAATQMQELSDERSPSLELREAGEQDLLTLHSLEMARRNRFDVTVEEWKALLDAQAYAGIKKCHHRIWIAAREGKAIAFAIIGAPNYPERDAEGILIEWAGEEEVVSQLLAAAYEACNLSTLRLEIPVRERLGAMLATRLGEGERKASYHTIKLLNLPRMMTGLAPYFTSLDPAVAQTLQLTQEENGKFHLSSAGISLLLSGEQLMRRLFDPLYAEGDEGAGDGGPLGKLLPVPLPFLNGLFYI